MSEVVEILFTRTWWEYTPDDSQWFTFLYHWFNVFEGCAWFVFAGLVCKRYRTHRNSNLEIWYALAFCTFGMTDFREAWVQSSWLLWVKLINLIVLLVLRRKVMTQHYPDAKLY